MLIENMLKETVVSQRIVYDPILTAGMDVKNTHINPKMITSVEQSHTAYKAALSAN